MTRVRPKAVCVVWRGEEILVGHGFDPAKEEAFFGPLGGEVEFGEWSHDAVRRELMEELGVELRDVELIGVLENVFEYDGVPGHEIVFVYEAHLADASLYALETMEGVEDNGIPFEASWQPLSRFAGGTPPLYPEGLHGLLAGRRRTA